MRIDFEGAQRALQWFSDHGVRTVVAAYYTRDGAEMRAFIQKAKDLDIVLFAGTNNDRTRTIPFPARDPYAIAVTGTNLNLDFATNSSMASWTAFKLNGDTPTNAMESTVENGSSFAVARAAAFGAHHLRSDLLAHRDDVVKSMRTAGGWKREDRTCDMDGGGVIRRFRMALATPRSPAIGPSGRGMADAVATSPPNDRGSSR